MTMRIYFLNIMFFLLLVPCRIDGSEQPPYEVPDPAVSENFREIYQTMDIHRHAEDDSSRPFDLIPSSGLTYSLGSATTKWAEVHVDSATIEQVNASTVTVNGSNIFVSSANISIYQGYVLYFASGAIAAQETVTLSTVSFNARELGIPVCSEAYDADTSTMSVRIRSLGGLPGSFTVFNADPANAKNFTCFVPGKPR